MMRETQRDAILKLMNKSNQAGINLSMNVSARNNVFKQLHDDPDFPARLDRRTFFGYLRDMQTQGLIKEEPYLQSNRTQGQRVVLTDTGRQHLENKA